MAAPTTGTSLEATAFSARRTPRGDLRTRADSGRSQLAFGHHGPMMLRVLLPGTEATFVLDWTAFEVTREGVLTVRRESGAVGSAICVAVLLDVGDELDLLSNVVGRPAQDRRRLEIEAAHVVEKDLIAAHAVFSVERNTVLSLGDTSRKAIQTANVDRAVPGDRSTVEFAVHAKKRSLTNSKTWRGHFSNSRKT